MGVCGWQSNPAAAITKMVMYSASPASILIAFLAIAAVQGCSEHSSPIPAKEVAAAPLVPFPDIASFEKKAPNDLVADPIIGKVIRSIVPQAQLKCMDEIFNYMPDLQLLKDGSVTAELTGSHADNWMIGYVNASPTGEINIVLQCDPHANNKPPYLYFTTRNIAVNAPDALLNWYYIVAGEQDVVRVSDGKETREIPSAQLLKEMISGAAKPLQDQSSTSQQQTASSDEVKPFSGQWTCTNNRGNGNNVISFGTDGSLEWVDDPGRPTVSHRLGTFQKNKNELEIVISKIPELTRYGRSPNVSISERAEITSSSPKSLRFTWWQNSDPSDKVTFSCSPYEVAQSPTPKATKSQPVEQGAYGGDRVAVYANNLANELERSSHPTCQMLANSIRSFGNSGAPDVARLRQVDNLFNKAPSFCVR